MDVFIKYFLPMICLIFLSTIPLYVMRIVMYFKRKHFILEKSSVKQAMYIHGGLYIAFAATTFFLRNSLNEYTLYVLLALLVMLVALFIGYRIMLNNTRRHKYSVVFSKWNNREAWQKVLDEKKLTDVDITDGAFSFVSKIKFSYMETIEIVELFKEFDHNTDLLHELNTRKAYGLLVLQVALFSLALVSFALLFVLLTYL